MSNNIRTIRYYDLYEAVSALQKGIRRGDEIISGYFALELFASGFSNYLWKRLLTISAEDCYGLITQEIKSLYDSFIIVNSNKKEEGGRVFISKAILLLCHCNKSRDADHLGIIVYDKKIPTEEDINKFLKEIPLDLDIPEYAYDVHTLKGKMRGKTKEQFIKEEFNSLKPKVKGILDYLI